MSAQPQIIFGITNMASGLLCIAISIPLVLRRIAMNRFYGFRFAAAFLSEEKWFQVNAYGGRQLILFSIPTVVSGLGCFFISPEAFSSVFVTIAVGLGPFTVFTTAAAVRTYIYSRRLGSRS